MPKSINLSGSPGKNYNLEKLSTENTRTDSSKALMVQIWYWNADVPGDGNPHKFPNPPAETLSIGNIWLSKHIDAASDPDNYSKICNVKK